MTTKKETGGAKRGLEQSRRPRTGTSAVRPRALPVVSCQIQVPFDKRLRIAGILRGTAHSKVGSHALELGLPIFEERNPVMSEEISASTLAKLNEAGFTYEDAIEYIRSQPSSDWKIKRK